MLWQAYPDIQIILTTAPEQQELAQHVCSWLQDHGCPAYLYVSKYGLNNFAQVIGCAQILLQAVLDLCILQAP